MTSRKPWTVLRLWWELTKLVLARRGSYDIGVVLHNPHDDADPHVKAVGDTANWQVTDLDWVGGYDRFAVLTGEPDYPPAYDRQGLSR